jgi:hypothetical protein
MGRRIVSTKLEAVGGGENVDGWADRIVKYIPADVVAAWIAVNSMITSNAPTNDTVLWVVFFVFVVLTALWMWKTTHQPNAPVPKTQIILATISFIVWVFGFPNGPFATLSFYQSNKYLGGVVLIIWTLIVGLIVPPEPTPPPPPAPATT